jgi:hypothetical protein
MVLLVLVENNSHRRKKLLGWASPSTATKSARQNWTDGFAVEFEKRNGYNLLLLLSVMTGRVIDNAKASDQFLWDLRRTVADLIAEIYVGGLRDISHENGLRLWCENYGHWGFPGELTIYGGYSDEVGGEFRVGQPLGKSNAAPPARRDTSTANARSLQRLSPANSAWKAILQWSMSPARPARCLPPSSLCFTTGKTSSTPNPPRPYPARSPSATVPGGIWSSKTTPKPSPSMAHGNQQMPTKRDFS